MRRIPAACLFLLAAILQTALGSSAEAAAGAPRTIHFAGRTVDAPASWPVIRLAERPRTCVRLDRRAVYLGSPSPEQRCPAGAMGRRRAILVDPRGGHAATSLAAPPLAHLSVGSEFTGLGFDACTAPSRRSMAAWAESPYRAVGVYIGGTNRACSQPSLTASWVSEQIAEGWQLIPTYVGLQSPTSSCTSCAKLSAGGASSQGTAAADDAVAQARIVGIGPGSPIYFDMESYTRTSSSTAATLTFLAAWTTRLHALGYTSGVYSSSASGIADIAAKVGESYPLPDDLWIANWNGRKNTADPYVPASAWSDHQRIHQYSGGHDETYGGVTINIDGDYVEGATAGVAAPGGDDPKGKVELVGSPGPGHVRIAGWAFDPSSPTTPLEIRAYVGGKTGAQRVDLGPIAALDRQDVAAGHRAAGAAHGFDSVFATTKSGSQRVCAYAVDVGAGDDRLLGCRATGIGVAVTVTRLRAYRGGVRLRLACEWPAGTECPGQVLLRARVRTRPARGRRGLASRVVRVGLARRPFKLSGGGSLGLSVPLSRRGRTLAAAAEGLRSQLVVAIPGGRRVVPLRLR